MIPLEFSQPIEAMAASAKGRVLGIPRSARIYVAGHRGLVGSAIIRQLQAGGYQNLVLRSRAELDLRDAAEVDRFFRAELPNFVFLAAARAGGILANAKHPVDFYRDNSLIALNVLDAAWRHGAEKLLFLGSSSIYPRLAAQPIREEELLNGHLEPSTSANALAKIGAIELCRAYRKQHGFRAISLMPANLYGPGDNFDGEDSHVIPALLRRMHEAKVHRKDSVGIWGSGTPRREFLHVDDLAAACLMAMQSYDSDQPLNVGFGEDLTVAELAHTIREVVGYNGKLHWDRTKPDGVPQKLLESSRIRELGWKPKIRLRPGIEGTYDWYCANVRDRNLRKNLFSPTGLWEPSHT